MRDNPSDKRGLTSGINTSILQYFNTEEGTGVPDVSHQVSLYLLRQWLTCTTLLSHTVGLMLQFSYFCTRTRSVRPQKNHFPYYDLPPFLLWSSPFLLRIESDERILASFFEFPKDEPYCLEDPTGVGMEVIVPFSVK